MSQVRADSHIQKKIVRAVSEALESRLLMSFGLTTSTNSYTVDTGADVVFSINRTTALGGSIGDLTSILYDGTQLEAPFSYPSRYSHYESGLSNNTVVSATTDPNGNWIEIACNDTGSGGVGVIQYYIAYKGMDNIYMATYAASLPSPGEMRFITYLNHQVLTNAPAPSDLIGNTGAIESTDVYGFANGQTASKYYGESEATSDPYHGLTGNGFGAFMNMGSRENSSGGPFYKDIDYQTTSSANTDATGWTELYNYMYSGHSQTENFRPGLQGPYALQFTNGSAPAAVDYSFIDGLNLQGQIHVSARGTLTGSASGVPSGDTSTVALINANAQFWATPDPTTGSYTISAVEPGTYTETLYQNELAVGTQAVTISTGLTTTSNISDALSSAYSTSADIFRIGSWDGTPVGFLNANLIQNMHPSDSRLSPWVNTTYTVGTTADSSWPMAEWEFVSGTPGTIDSTDTIDFTLTAAQAAEALTFRIGIARAGSNGRPIISVNGGSYGSAPYISNQPTDRGVTVGNWRGNNSLYMYNLSGLHSGSNSISIEIASGSKNTSESAYLQPWVIFDAIDLVPTVTVASIALAPAPPAIVTTAAGASNPPPAQIFIATPRDSSGNAILANLVWSATRGTIDSSGHYVAPTTAGTDTVTVSSGGISSSVTFNIIAPDAAPTVATAASANPSSITGKTASLSVLGADDDGESNLTYVWSATGTPPAAVNFSANQSNAAKNTVATFTAAGSYSFLVTITDAQGLSVTSTVNVTVTLTATSIAVSPASPQISDGQNTQLSATLLDQFGNAMSQQPTFIWTVDSGGVGSVSGTGLYSAPASGPASDTVRATSGSISGTAIVTVILSNIAGTLGSDNIRLVRSGVLLQVYIGTPLAYSVPFASLGAVTVSGGSGNDIVTVDFSGGATPIPAGGLTIDGGSGSDIVGITGTSNSDSLSVSSSSITADGGTISLVNDESIALTAIGNQPIVLGSLSIAAGALLQTNPSGSAALTLSTIPTIAGTLDLENTQLTVQSAGATGLSALTTLLRVGFNAGAGYWNGTGIISSLVASDPTYLSTLGIILNSSNNVVIQPTYYGDADLNGVLNGADYQQIDNGFGMHLSGWSNGDFNYDGVVDGSDYSLIDNAFNQVQAGTVIPLAMVKSAPALASNKTIKAANTTAVIAATIFADSSENVWKLYIESGDDSILIS